MRSCSCSFTHLKHAPVFMYILHFEQGDIFYRRKTKNVPAHPQPKCCPFFKQKETQKARIPLQTVARKGMRRKGLCSVAQVWVLRVLISTLREFDRKKQVARFRVAPVQTQLASRKGVCPVSHVPRCEGHCSSSMDYQNTIVAVSLLCFTKTILRSSIKKTNWKWSQKCIPGAQVTLEDTI